jgi:trehalose synthase-fused probable maltokinase
VTLASAFALRDVPPSVLAFVDVTTEGRPQRYAVAFVDEGAGLREAGESDGVWRALAVSIAEGRVIPALPRPAETTRATREVDAALVCRPASGLTVLWPDGPVALAAAPERALGNDQSNTSVVLAERLLLKVFRRVDVGLNPDLELNAFLAEEVGFAGVPRVAGFAELVARDGIATVAMLSEFVPEAADVYESTAERLTAWILAPGRVTVEHATEAVEDLGRLTAALHAALTSAPADIPELAPRDATRDEVRAWGREARRRLDGAVAAVSGDVAAELRTAAPAIAARFTVFDALPATPRVSRIHGDLHLGQLILAPDGYRIVDFEGEPTRPIDERSRPDSPLRDVASMLRSLDHVGRSARRRAERRNGGLVSEPGLDIDAWLDRARERFLEGYGGELRERGSPIVLDEDLLLGFEFSKEANEFVYAARYLPDWLWAPREGMRWLVDRFGGER